MTPGKGAPPDSTPVETPAPSITPEEAAKHQRMEHARKEFRAALLHEGGPLPPPHFSCPDCLLSIEVTVKARLNLVKSKVLEIVRELKVREAIRGEGVILGVVTKGVLWEILVPRGTPDCQVQHDCGVHAHRPVVYMHIDLWCTCT